MDIDLSLAGLLKKTLYFLIDRAVDSYRRLTRIRLSEHESPVSFSDKIVFEKLDTVCQSLLILSDKHESARIHIDPVAELGILKLGRLADLVDQGILDITFSGVDGNARKFVEEMESSGTADSIRAEEGNLRYDYFFSAADPETVLLIDSWASQKAIDAHHATPMMETIA